ncbi:MAG TPA: heme exporter protein CcmB [Caulobacteraceae bacterium]
MSPLAVLYRRELALAWGGGGGPLLACAFYACLCALTPLAVGSDPQRLASMATGSAWLSLALASLLSLERLYERDYEHGALDLLANGPAPLEAVCAMKALAQWTATGLPLSVLAPLAAVALGAGVELAGLTFVCALAAGLGFAFTGGLGAALALGARRGGVLIAVVVLPLFAPPVIFGAGAVEAARMGLDWAPPLAFLAAYTLFACALAPFASAAAVRNALD